MTTGGAGGATSRGHGHATRPPFPHVESLIRRFWQGTEGRRQAHVFVILDGARDERVYPAIVESACPNVSLYIGDITPDLVANGPHLLQLDARMTFTKWLLGQGWGDAWGVWLLSTATMRDLRRHFRRFLQAQFQGKPYYFRYYDPRVLRAYLPACDAQELATFFGPVDRFFVEDEEPAWVHEYALNDGKLRDDRARADA